MKIWFTVLGYNAHTISILNSTKEHNSIKTVGRVMVLNLCTSSDDALYLYQNLRKISHDLHTEIYQGA